MKPRYVLSISVVDGVLIEPEVMVDAAEVVLFGVARYSVSFVISCTESSESAPLESSRIFPTSTKSAIFCPIILVMCPTASDYSRIILAKFSTHYSSNYAGIIGAGLVSEKPDGAIPYTIR